MAAKKNVPVRRLIPGSMKTLLKSLGAVLLILLGGVLFNLDRLDSVSIELLKHKQLIPKPFRSFLPGESVPEGRPEGGEVISGRIIEVYDGDTATLLTRDKRYRIRFYGIDAPEKDQRYGIESRDALREKILGRDVEVIVVSVDLYGRSVGRIKLGGRDINREMIAEGMAWYYEDYARDDYQLADAQQEARDRHLGLWIDNEPQPPWEYRRAGK